MRKPCYFPTYVLGNLKSIICISGSQGSLFFVSFLSWRTLPVSSTTEPINNTDLWSVVLTRLQIILRILLLPQPTLPTDSYFGVFPQLPYLELPLFLIHHRTPFVSLLVFLQHINLMPGKIIVPAPLSMNPVNNSEFGKSSLSFFISFRGTITNIQQ